MQYPALLIADLHLTDVPRDAYRWGLFEWLKRTCREEKVKTLAILGDLTDRKDYHSSGLTNRIAREIKALTEVVREIKIIPGNHDWLLNGEEFFRFLNLIPGVSFMTRPTEDPDVKGPLTLYLPFTKNPARDWKPFDFQHCELVFMHQTLKGAISSNGEAMEGEELPDLSAAGKIWSGDIHVPQVIEAVEYVGSPYHVHFGDAFKPRCVLLENGGHPVDLHFDTISRVTVNIGANWENEGEIDAYRLRAGDQVKLRVSLSEADKHEWARIRRTAVEALVDVGVSVEHVELIVKKSKRRVSIDDTRARSRGPEDVVARFIDNEDLGATAFDIAMEVIER